MSLFNGLSYYQSVIFLPSQPAGREASSELAHLLSGSHKGAVLIYRTGEVTAGGAHYAGRPF